MVAHDSGKPLRGGLLEWVHKKQSGLFELFRMKHFFISQPEQRQNDTILSSFVHTFMTSLISRFYSVKFSCKSPYKFYLLINSNYG